MTIPKKLHVNVLKSWPSIQSCMPEIMAIHQIMYARNHGHPSNPVCQKSWPSIKSCMPEIMAIHPIMYARNHGHPSNHVCQKSWPPIPSCMPDDMKLKYSHSSSNLTTIFLIHWGRVTHICIGKPSDAYMRQAIIWTNAWLLLIEPLGTNFSEILIGIQTFSSKKLHLKMSSAKWPPLCLGLNVLNHCWRYDMDQYLHQTGNHWYNNVPMS